MSRVPGWQPTAQQELLLHACLSRDDEAARLAFAAWRKQGDIERLDHGSYRLLPLLWKRIESFSTDDPARDLIKGVYRRTWYANQLVLARVSRLASQFAAAGISVMAIKGAALTIRDYRDPGVRPMDDVDLAVPIARAAAAIDLLITSGWLPEATPLTATRVMGAAAQARWAAETRQRSRFDDAYFGTRHAHGFRATGGGDIDLHWHVFQGHCDPSDDDDLWAVARPDSIQGVPIRVLDPADHLLLLLVHGARWNPFPVIRWIADAVTLLRVEEHDLQWERFVENARRRRYTLIASTFLGYLTRFVDVPADVIESLRCTPTTSQERRDFALDDAPPGLRAGIRELGWLYGRYRALRRRGAWSGPGGFMAYLRHVLGAPSLLAVGRYAASESLRRLQFAGSIERKK
jgi:hypothetical protein